MTLTLEIPQELADAAESKAAAEGRSVHELVLVLLRKDTQGEAWAVHEEIRQKNEKLREQMANFDPNRRVTPEEHAARMKVLEGIRNRLTDEDRAEIRRIQEVIDEEFGSDES